MKTITAFSSHGTIDFDSETGLVISQTLDECNDCCPNNIGTFDVKEYARTYGHKPDTDIDILDLGYWLKDGTYEEPAYDWRDGTALLPAQSEIEAARNKNPESSPVPTVPIVQPLKLHTMSNYGIKPHDTNIKLVKNYMEWGSPMNQMFLIDAISKQATRIVEVPEKVKRQFHEAGTDKWLSPDAWIQSAQDWLDCNRIRDNDDKGNHL